MSTIIFVVIASVLPIRKSFADYLLIQGDTFSAITEYWRAYYSSDSMSLRDEIAKKIASIYIAETKPRNALYALQKSYVRDTCFKKLYGFSMLLLGSPDSAILYFDFNRNYRGLAYIAQGNYREAGKIFPPDVLPLHRSPLLAGILSMIIPGMGRVYTKRYGDGFYSFVLTAGTGALSYYYYQYEKKKTAAIAFSLLSFSFYTGDIYGSIVSAMRFNYLHRIGFIHKSVKQYLKD